MRSDEGQNNWDQRLEKLKEEWIEFSEEAFRAILEEEMKLRRKELDTQAGTENHVEVSQGALEQ